MSTELRDSHDLSVSSQSDVFGFEALKEKTALVTGGSRGIGRAVAMALAEGGADVVVNYRDSVQAANAVCVEARRLGVRSVCCQANVSRAADIERLVENVRRNFGRVDILVNNAGITRDKSFLKMTPEMWEDVMETNLHGPALLSRAVLPAMIEARWGRIINVASIVGQTGNFGQTNYSAAKGGLIAFTKSLARETARKGITVNAVAPGFVETDMTRDMQHEALQSVRVATPIGRLGKPREIAAAVAFLALPVASYITGEVISVNGGMYM